MKIPNLTYYNNQLVGAPKISTDLLWDLSLVFGGLAFIYLAIIFYSKRKNALFNSKVEKLKTRLSPMISEFLFLGEDATKDEKSNFLALKIELRQMLNDDFNRKVFTEVLLDLRKDLSGETRESICELYQDFGLDKDAYTKLNSWRWQLICKGIIELTQMQVIESYNFLCKYIRDPRSIIRKQAEIAIVSLKDEGINYFLDNTRYKISEWQQLKLIDVLRNKKDFQAPSFKDWLTSNNRHVVLFSLRLIKHYNQNDAESSVIELVKHKSNQIKGAAISCIRDFSFMGALDNMKLVFWSSNISVKILILDAISQLGSEADLEFLKQIQKKESNFLVKSKALSSINRIAPESIMPFKGIQKNSQYKIPEDIIETDDKSNEGETELFDEMLNYDIEDLSIEQNSEEENVVDEVPFELIVDVDSIEHKKDVAAKELENEVPEKEETTIDLNFLPLVTEEEHGSVAYAYDVTDKVNALALNEMEVLFEKVPSEVQSIEFTNNVNEQTSKARGLEEFDMDLLHFLPVVVDNEEEDSIEEPSLNDIEVIIEEIKPELETEDELLAFEPLEADKPNEEEEEAFENIDLDLSNYGILSTDNTLSKYDTKEIKLCKVVYEEVVVDSDVTTKNIKLIDVVDAVMVPTTPSKIPIQAEHDELDLSFIPLVTEGKIHQTATEESKDSTEIDFSDFEIPKASIAAQKYEDVEFEATTRQLLNDLEEMGDEREIPFLNDLLQDETYETYKPKIEVLIQKIKNVNSKSPTPELLKNFNVFEDLFRTCDQESKMILLDEMFSIGNEDEYEFLEQLIHDDNQQIRTKAKEVLQHLQSKFNGVDEPFEAKKIQRPNQDLSSIMEELEISSSNQEELFDVSFEFSETTTTKTPKKADKKPIKPSYLRTLLTKVNSITSKIKSSFNG